MKGRLDQGKLIYFTCDFQDSSEVVLYGTVTIQPAC